MAIYLKSVGMDQVRGAPNHYQTQGKIERHHRSMKNVIKLELYNSPKELTYQLEEFVDYYADKQYHESRQNISPADVYFGIDKQILRNRILVKQKTIPNALKIEVRGQKWRHDFITR